MGMENDVAVITGGGRGVGRGIALEFAGRGAKVAVLDLDEDVALETAEEVKSAGVQALGIKADVTDRTSIDTALTQVRNDLGAISVLVNNAGTWINRRFIETSRDDWDLEIGLNLYGVLNATQAVIPDMIEANYGRIINISSDAGRVGQPTNAVYSGAKAGVNGFSRALAKELGRYLVTVNVISLSFMETRQTANMVPDEATYKKIVSGYAIRRIGTPDDAANAAAFLADRRSEWITGQTLGVDGGYVMS